MGKSSFFFIIFTVICFISCKSQTANPTVSVDTFKYNVDLGFYRFLQHRLQTALYDSGHIELHYDSLRKVDKISFVKQSTQTTQTTDKSYTKDTIHYTQNTIKNFSAVSKSNQSNEDNKGLILRICVILSLWALAFIFLYVTFHS